MEHIEQVNDGAPITVFEVITAAAFVLFAATPADLCVLEVGLGGRGDATNVITPAACAVTSISLDHKEMLGDTLALIATEKAGIFKPGIPSVTGLQPAEAMAALEAVGPVRARGRDWWIEPDGAGLRYSDAEGEVPLPRDGSARTAPDRQCGHCGGRHPRRPASASPTTPARAGAMAGAAAAPARAAGRTRPGSRAMAGWRP